MAMLGLRCPAALRGLALLALALALTGCATVNLGVSVPLGRGTSVGVGVGSDGRVGAVSYTHLTLPTNREV